jgi:hypothetical protein
MQGSVLYLQSTTYRQSSKQNVYNCRSVYDTLSHTVSCSCTNIIHSGRHTFVKKSEVGIFKVLVPRASCKSKRLCNRSCYLLEAKKVTLLNDGCLTMKGNHRNKVE